MVGQLRAIAQANIDPSAFVATRPGLLAAYRRWFAVAAILLLATPFVWGLFLPDSPEWILKEARNPAPAPRPPRSVDAMLALPREADSYLRDHFGLRQKMIKLHKDLTHPFLFERDGALIGESGRMYAFLDDMLAQSAGHVVRAEKVDQTANMLAAMHDELARQGVRFLVAFPPNSSSIYQADLPHWARNPGRKTEYDLLFEKLAARGVKTVDLRPPLKAASADGLTYLLNDLHWSVRGVIAGFNAVVEADGHPDWRVDPSSSIGPLAVRNGGDIAQVAGVADKATEQTETLTLKAVGHDEQLPDGVAGMPDHVTITGRPGPTIVVIGDSFTTSYFPLFLSQHVGRAVWLHHEYCSFDWSWISRIKPDEVWWTPVERFSVCRPGQSLKNFPEPQAGQATLTNR
jgi:hypothetical protein